MDRLGAGVMYHLTYARCYPCMLGQCSGADEPEPTPHTWLDVDDIEHFRSQGREIPDDPAEQARRFPCACWCAGQSGPHVQPKVTPDEGTATG